MSDAEEIGKRLREWGLGKYSTLSEFARKLGIAPQNLNNYLVGKRTPGNKLKIRLEELGCDVAWLMFGQSKEEIDERVARMFAGAAYPLVSKIRAGHGVDPYELRSRERIPGPGGVKFKGAVYFEVDGKSMEPRWEEGDLVLVQPGLFPKSGGYAVVGWGTNNHSLKRIYFRDGEVILQPLSPGHAPIVIERSAIWFMGRVLFTRHKT